MHEIRADEAVSLSNDGQPLCLSKGKPQPLLLLSMDIVDIVEMRAKSHHVEGATPLLAEPQLNFYDSVSICFAMNNISDCLL
eukprot:4823669-Pleurochrysis_carterae.AAC.1